MKARGISALLLTILACLLIFLNGCHDSDNHSSEKTITSYSLNGVEGTINETDKTIIVNMPSLTNVYSLVATFTTTGQSVAISTTQQTSGTTVNNFSSPVIYTVTAEDESTATYTITVTVNRKWHHPATVTDYISLATQNAESPQVAMDNKGNAIIVWYQYATFETNFGKDHLPGKIFKSEYRNGVWTNPASFSDCINPGGTSAKIPQVAMDNNGNAIIVWMQYDGTNWQTFKSEYRNGAWVHPASISDNISPDLQNDYGVHDFGVSVAMDDNGNAVISWNQFDGNHGRIFKSEYRNGVWHHPASLADNISPDGQDAWFPRVAMDNRGNAIIVWYQNDNTSHKIFKSEYRNGVWHHPTSLADNINPNGLFAYYPKVAMDNNGNAIIVWEQYNGENYQIFKSEYRNGDWHHPANLSDYISLDGQSAGSPQVAMNNNGNAIINWHQFNDIDFKDHIFKSEYRSGAWTYPASLTDYTQNASSPLVVMDNKGNAIISWSQSDDTRNYYIFKSEYRNGVWKHPLDLSDSINPYGPYEYAHVSQVVMDDTGNAIIVWQQYDGFQYRIFKSEYR
ncbi:MAG: hypothetical protein JW925_00660 [Syntrophaceae bacterium]|nr:hypothetical protein [Syntrophaceae bacterium]